VVRWHARRGIVRPALEDGPRFLERLAIEIDLPVLHRYRLSGQGHRSFDQQLLFPLFVVAPDTWRWRGCENLTFARGCNTLPACRQGAAGFLGNYHARALWKDEV